MAALPLKQLITVGAYGLGAMWAMGFIGQVSGRAVKAAKIHGKVKRREWCISCGGSRYYQCQVCLGSGYYDYQTLVKADEGLVCICPLCLGTGEQTCANCLGAGVTLR